MHLKQILGSVGLPVSLPLSADFAIPDRPMAACPDGTVVSDAAGAQSGTRTAPDGPGGSCVTWLNPVAGKYQLLAQRVDATSRSLAGWPASGLVVTNLTLAAPECSMATELSGRLAACSASNVSSVSKLFVQRLSTTGILGLGASGIGVFTSTFSEARPLLAADETGDCFIAAEISGSRSDIYIQRLDSGGALWSDAAIASAAQWTANGRKWPVMGPVASP